MLIFEPCFIVSHASSVRCKSSSQNVLPETLLPPLGGAAEPPGDDFGGDLQEPILEPGEADFGGSG